MNQWETGGAINLSVATGSASFTVKLRIDDAEYNAELMLFLCNSIVIIKAASLGLDTDRMKLTAAQALEAIDLQNIRELRRASLHDQAFEFVSRFQEKSSLPASASATLLWAHRPFWWSVIASRRISLQRCSPNDAEYLRRLWADSSFMRAYSRNADSLPQSDSELAELLSVRYCATVLESKSLQWVIKNKSNQRLGLISLANISLAHRHAEVLLGIPHSHFAVGVSAMLMLFDFFFNTMQFHKLYSFVFPDNPHSLRGTLQLGFKQEGLLRQHAYDSKDNRFYDVVQTGLLRDEAFSSRNQRLASRFLL